MLVLRFLATVVTFEGALGLLGVGLMKIDKKVRTAEGICIQTLLAC